MTDPVSVEMEGDRAGQPMSYPGLHPHTDMWRRTQTPHTQNRVMESKWKLGNGSVGKVFLMQVWGPEFGSPEHK